MHTPHRLFSTLILFTGLLFAFVMLAPTSAVAQQTETRTAETVDRAPERTETRSEAETSAPAPKSAHTPATTIENSSGNTILQTSEGGSLLAPGLGGAIPAEGAGVRMMWYPDQKAFRAGEVGKFKDGSQWDADSIGGHSVAFGVDTKATGDLGSVAMGERTVASRFSAVAMGFLTTASGTNSTAMGNNTDASGFNSTAMGENTVASGNQSTAMGLDTETTGNNSVAMGAGTFVNDDNALGVGFQIRTGPDNSLYAGRCNSTFTGIFTVGNGTLNSDGDACDVDSDALVLESDGDMTIAGTLIENSDRRMKTNIEPIGEDVLNALQEIDPVRFRFKNQQTHPAGAQIGLIAQDVQKEFPELVTEGGDGMLSLSYTKFSAVLLKGLQEQQTTIDQQEERIATLEAENKEIKERLAALEVEQSTPAAAGLMGSWALALLLGLGGLVGGILWRRRS